jgi:hypothetical protein
VVDEVGEIFGDAPNVAACVQALAEPGTVMVTARVRRQVSGLFVAEDRGAHLLKGASEPTTLFRIVRASGGRRGGARSLTPLVGRKEELTQLRRQWDRARDGEGQLTLIVGEPGIGKSRLLEEFRATPVLGSVEQTSSRSPSTFRGELGRLPPFPLSSLSIADSWMAAVAPRIHHPLWEGRWRFEGIKSAKYMKGPCDRQHPP